MWFLSFQYCDAYIYRDINIYIYDVMKVYGIFGVYLRVIMRKLHVSFLLIYFWFGEATKNLHCFGFLLNFDLAIYRELIFFFLNQWFLGIMYLKFPSCCFSFSFCLFDVLFIGWIYHHNYQTLSNSLKKIWNLLERLYNFMNYLIAWEN